MSNKSENSLMQLLKEKKLSQEAFARLAGVSLNTAARWVRGKQCPSMPPWKFLALSAELGVEPSVLAEAMREAHEKANEF